MLHPLIQSVQNPLVKHLTKLRKSRSYRYETGRVVIEGKKMVQELATHCRLILTTDPTSVPAKCAADEIYQVTEEILKKITGVLSPEGIIAEVVMPAAASLKQSLRLLVLDQVSDPGNLGTLLRTAEALGWDGAFLIEPCCDPFNDKALRAAKGATFRLPLAWGGVEDLLSLTKACTLLAADAKGKPLTTLTTLPRIALVLGSEGQGVSEAILHASKTVSIPMEGEAESLNVAVAGGILMHTLHKWVTNE